jgi:hypothetical protein
MMVDDTLTRLDPATMQLTTIGKLSGVERGVDLMAWQGDDLYLTSHENLLKVALPHR